MTPTEIRTAVWRNGYAPIPVEGKRPRIPGWQTKTQTNVSEISLWDKLGAGNNTGILCQKTPTIDVDITIQPAAEAVEELAREMFEEHGFILVRVGNAPKRAILLRTDEPFTKVSALFTAPDGSEQKIEILGDGQQVVVNGIHPDTGKPYSWHGGTPWQIGRRELPYVRRDNALAFLDRAAEVLVRDFGFIRHGTTPRINGEDHEHSPRASWDELIANIVSGRDLHDSTTRLAASFLSNGLNELGTRRVLEAIMLAGNMPHDDRWKDRFDDIARSVSSATGKFGKPDIPDKTSDRGLFLSSREFIDGLIPPKFLVKGILQRGFIYSLTAATGCGKTAISLLLSMCVTQGALFGQCGVKSGGVLYCAGENPHDIRQRWLVLCQYFNVDVDIKNIWFMPGVFKFSELADRISQEAMGKNLALVVVDTSAAYFEGDEENSNTQIGEHARRLRQILIGLDGGPTVIVNAHPIKHAQDDNLLPRGGGAFLAEVDGNLTLRKTETAVELHWQGKFRGPEFPPMSFQLDTVTHELLKDEDGNLVKTVIAKPISDQGVQEIQAAKKSTEDEILLLVADGDGAMSAREMAIKLNLGHHSRAQRVLKSLERDRLVERVRDEWLLTDKGKKLVARIKNGKG